MTSTLLSILIVALALIPGSGVAVAVFFTVRWLVGRSWSRCADCCTRTRRRDLLLVLDVTPGREYRRRVCEPCWLRVPKAKLVTFVPEPGRRD